MKIHPSFSLQGVFFGENFEQFKDQVLCRSADQDTLCYLKQNLDFISQWLSPAPTITCMTSGTSGAPKQFEASKQKMTASALMTGEHFSLGENTRALHCLPVSFIAGQMMLVRSMCLGWHLHAVSPSSEPVDENEYDFAAMSPMQFYGSVSRLDHIKKILVGGASVNTSFIDSLRQRKDLNSQIYQSYASTETLSHVAIRKLFPNQNDHYTALRGVNFSTDERDCLVIEAADMLDNKLITNDIVELIDSKTFIWIGRADSVINSAGIKIHPESIEPTLSELIKNQYFVCGLPHPIFGQAVVLFVEGDESDYPDLEGFVIQKLSPYQRPKSIVYIKKIPLTHSAKIDRQKLISQYKNLFTEPKSI